MNIDCYRSMDDVPASIEVLHGIAKEAKRKSLDTYLDGGIRTGSDVFKALALGNKTTWPFHIQLKAKPAIIVLSISLFVYTVSLLRLSLLKSV